MKKLFIATTFLCILFLFIYHFVLNDTTEIDLLSHFFGGISVTIALTYITTNFSPTQFNRPEIILFMLFIAIAVFELLEYLFFTYLLTDIYPLYTQEYVMSIVNIADTTTDTIAGMIGGTLYLIYKRHGATKY